MRSALYDFMNPDRVVLGSKDEAAEKVAQLHLPLHAHVLTDLRTAEMTSTPATRFGDQDQLHQRDRRHLRAAEADADVAIGMSYDKRIGPHFLNAGLG